MWIQQPIQQPWGVSVFGSALVDALPDLALLRFAAVSVANKPADAFNAAHNGGAKIRQTLSTAGVGEGSVQTSRVTLDSVFEFRGGQQHFVGYRARLAYRVRMTQLDDIERLVSQLVESGANHIEGLEFQSSQIRELRAQARAAAVAAARQKAEIYVQAAGAKLGPLLHIEDVNPDTLRARGHEAPVDLSQHGDDSVEVLRTGSITIAAAVVAGFAINAAG
jgi:uncharacterized protein YggE